MPGAEIININERRVPKHNFIDRLLFYLEENSLKDGDDLIVKHVVRKAMHRWKNIIETKKEYYAIEHSILITPQYYEKIKPLETDIARVWYKGNGPIYDECKIETLLLAQMKKFHDKLNENKIHDTFFTKDGYKIEFRNCVAVLYEPKIRQIPLESAFREMEEKGVEKEEHITIGDNGLMQSGVEAKVYFLR